MPLVIVFFLGITLQFGGIIPPTPPPGGSELYTTEPNDEISSDGPNGNCTKWFEECNSDCSSLEDGTDKDKCESKQKKGCEQYDKHKCGIEMPISLGLELFLFFSGLILLYFFNQKRNLALLQNS